MDQAPRNKGSKRQETQGFFGEMAESLDLNGRTAGGPGDMEIQSQVGGMSRGFEEQADRDRVGREHRETHQALQM